MNSSTKRVQVLALLGVYLKCSEILSRSWGTGKIEYRLPNFKKERKLPAVSLRLLYFIRAQIPILWNFLLVCCSSEFTFWVNFYFFLFTESWETVLMPHSWHYFFNRPLIVYSVLNSLKIYGIKTRITSLLWRINGNVTKTALFKYLFSQSIKCLSLSITAVNFFFRELLDSGKIISHSESGCVLFPSNFVFPLSKRKKILPL